MAKTVGWLERPGWRQHTLCSQLMACYAVGAPDFMAELSDILGRYRGALSQLAVVKFPGEVLSYYWYPWHDRGWAKACVVARGWLDLRGYPEEIEALADRWGLHCDWAAPWLHACVVEYLSPDLPLGDLGLIPLNVGTDLESTFETLHGENDIQIKVTYHPWPPVVLRDPSQDIATTDWKQDFITARDKVKEEVSMQLEEQMAEIERRHQARGYIRRDREPSLSLHIRWLYLRIALKKVPREIALEESVGQDAVEKAIYQLARALSLHLPRNRASSVRR